MIGGGLSEAEKARLKETGELVQLANGAMAGYVNGKWKIVSGVKDQAKMRQIASMKRGQRSLSKKSAARAFNRYYRGRNYADEGARKAAVSRDKNSRPKDSSRIVETSRYLRNPARFDYPGVDDGKHVSTAEGNLAALERARAAPRSARRSGRVSPRGARAAHQIKRDANWSPKGRSGAGRRSKKQIEQFGGQQQQQQQQQQRQRQQQKQQQQQGGRAVSLKTAVKLLRSYYSQRYGRQQ